MSFARTKRAELSAAFAVTLIGILLAGWAVFQHAAPLVAPSAALIFLGGAWLGNALARHDVRLFPSRPASEQGEESR